jgi:hypothetical protein
MNALQRYAAEHPWGVPADDAKAFGKLDGWPGVVVGLSLNR